MNIKALREQKHLTQEELANKSGVSIRTIQRIEAGQEPKGHTARVLAKALDIDINTFNKKTLDDKNFSLVKIINLSSIFVCFIPPLNIILPVIIMYYKKQFNTTTKQIISIQIIWTIITFLMFFISATLKNAFSLSHRLPLWIMISLIIINIYIILKNAAGLDRNQKLTFKLNFNFI